MKFFEKTVKYFKFFEDSKLIEVDKDHNRIAIVFYGKENIIHIFDTLPYLEYKPLEESIEIEAPKQINTIIKGETEKELDHNLNNNIDALAIFNQLNKKSDNTNKLIKTDDQEYIIFNNLNKNKTQDNLYTQKSLEYLAEAQMKKVKYNILKPPIKSKLLSVICTVADVLIGVKWLNISHLGFSISNGQEKSKLLLTISYDGNVNIYTLKTADYSIKTQINLNLLQTVPFESFPEQWKGITHCYTGRPIKDYSISSKPNNLYTLHIDNFIYVWLFNFVNNKLTIISNYCVNPFYYNPINKILVNSKEGFIYLFYDSCFRIFIIPDQPPLVLIYTVNYKDIPGNYDTNEEVSIHSSMISPIKKNNNDNNFVADTYDIECEDLIDKDEAMKLYDMHFFFNVQKPEFTLLDDYLLIPYYIVSSKKYIVYKFKNRLFLNSLTTNFNFFNNCCQNIKNTDSIYFEVVKVSDYPINFSIAPSFYLNISYVNHDRNTGSLLDLPLNVDTIRDNCYMPLVIINNGYISMVNTDSNIELVKYELTNQDVIQPDLVLLKWIGNNSVLLTSSKNLLHLVKFCNESNVLGIPINPSRVEQLIRNK